MDECFTCQGSWIHWFNDCAPSNCAIRVANRIQNQEFHPMWYDGSGYETADGTAERVREGVGSTTSSWRPVVACRKFERPRESPAYLQSTPFLRRELSRGQKMIYYISSLDTTFNLHTVLDQCSVCNWNVVVCHYNWIRAAMIFGEHRRCDS